MKAQKRVNPSKKKCIFCGEAARLTKEHLWSEWLSMHIPTYENPTYRSDFYENFGSHYTLKSRTERQGRVVTKRIRVVCGGCNGGWMSMLETEAKPILLSLFENTTSSLTRVQCETLARWVSVKCIVSEHDSGESALTPFIDRSNLFKNKEIPNYYNIYLGFQNTSVRSIFHRVAITLGFNPDGPNPPLPPGIARNTNAIIFVINDLVFYLFASRINDMPEPLSKLFAPPNLTRIHPISSDHLKLNREHAMNEFELRSLGDRMETILSITNPKRVPIWAPPPTHE